MSGLQTQLGTSPDTFKSLAQKMLRYRWFCYGILALTYICVYFDRVAPAVVAPELIKDFGISATMLGVLSSMYFYPYAAMQIPAGIFSDHMGPRASVAIFFSIAAIGTALFGLAPTFSWAIVGRFMMGLGVAVVWIPCVRILGNWFRPREFSTLMGLMLTWGNIGALIASAPLALLVGATGWRSAFFYLGAAMVLMAILNAVILRNKPTDMGFPTVSEIDGIDYYDTGGKIEKPLSVKEAVPMVLKKRNYWLIGIYAFMIYGTVMGFQGLWSVPYMTDIYGLPKQAAANALMFWAVGMAIGCVIIGYVSDRVLKSRRSTSFWFMVVYILTWIPLVFFPGTIPANLLWLHYFVMGFFCGAYVPNYAHISEDMPHGAIATASGMVNVFYFIGGATFQAIMGMVLDGYGQIDGKFPIEAYQATFIMCFVALIIGAIAMWFTTDSKTLQKTKAAQ